MARSVGLGLLAAVEVRFAAVRVVVPFEVADERGLREHVAHEQGLAPARVAEDHVRDEPLLLERGQHPEHAHAVARGFLEGASGTVRVVVHRAVGREDRLVHAGNDPFLARGLGGEDDLVARRAAEIFADVAELCGEIVVGDE